MDKIRGIFQQTSPYIGYITGGDGGLEYSVACAHALLQGGVDILEIGFPFSDPVADGPVIQRAHERALAAGTNALTLLEIAQRLRQRSDVPLVLFSYYNPILQKGLSYLRQLKEAGFDALLIVDLAIPSHPIAQEPFFQQVIDAGLLPILLATPSTSQERLLQIRKIAKGFLYYVSQKGTTGMRKALPEDFSLQMARVRPHFSLPIVAGFGIADRASAHSALQYADGFVVGSAFVKKMGEKVSPEELKNLAVSIDPRLHPGKENA